MNPYSQSLYLFGDFVFLAVWALLYWKAGQLRRQMLILSVLTALFGPFSEYWYFKDYWQPPIRFPFPVGGLEDLLFGFAIGGIAAVIYEVIFINHICLCERKKLQREWFLAVFGGIVLTSMVVLNTLLGINSIWASSLGFLTAGTLMVVKRPDLLPNAVGSGILVAITMFVIYYTSQVIFPSLHDWMTAIWKLEGTAQGITLFTHVPLSEMVWGLSWGFVWGPMYEFLVGARTLRIKRGNK